MWMEKKAKFFRWIVYYIFTLFKRIKYNVKITANDKKKKKNYQRKAKLNFESSEIFSFLVNQ